MLKRVAAAKLICKTAPRVHTLRLPRAVVGKEDPVIPFGPLLALFVRRQHLPPAFYHILKFILHGRSRKCSNFAITHSQTNCLRINHNLLSLLEEAAEEKRPRAQKFPEIYRALPSRTCVMLLCAI
jgi:hypothetical protein